MVNTKIDVVSGFLGAGKTTFIKRLVEGNKDKGKTIIIENEFGEIGIDGGFLKNSGIEIKEMNSGCICCSLAGDFEASLRELLSTYEPNRVIIEPSGVGKLSDVLKAISDVEKDLHVESNSAITVVDVKKCKMYMKNFGEFFNNQIQFANTIILSRTDLVDNKKIEEAVALIKNINPDATIVTTPLDKLSNEKIEELLSKPIDLKNELLEELAREHSHHHHHEDNGHHDNIAVVMIMITMITMSITSILTATTIIMTTNITTTTIAVAMNMTTMSITSILTATTIIMTMSIMNMMKTTTITIITTIMNIAVAVMTTMIITMRMIYLTAGVWSRCRQSARIN